MRDSLLWRIQGRSAGSWPHRWPYCDFCQQEYSSRTTSSLAAHLHTFQDRGRSSVRTSEEDTSHSLAVEVFDHSLYVLASLQEAEGRAKANLANDVVREEMDELAQIERLVGVNTVVDGRL